LVHTASRNISKGDARGENNPRDACSPVFDRGNFDINAILNNLTQGIRVIGQDCTVLYINRSFSELSGISPEEATGKKCWEVFRSPFCHTSECRLSKVMNGHNFVQAEIERTKPGGGVVPCVVTAFPFKNREGKLIGVMESFRDITERRGLLARVKESEEHYRALVEMGTEIGEAIVMLQDLPGREAAQVYMSDQWLKITGYSREEIQNTGIAGLILDTDRDMALGRYRKRMSGQVIPGLFEITVIRKDGSPVPVELTSAVSSYRNQPAAVVYLRDVSERKKVEEKMRLAEESLKKHREHLEELVAERTAKLMEKSRAVKQAEKRVNILFRSEQKLRRQLESQIKQRVEFTRALVHELKTPLTPLLGASDLLCSHLTDKPWSVLAAQAYKGASDLNRRIDELLDLTRDEIGVLELRYDSIDPIELVKDVAAYVAPSLGKKKQTLAIKIPGSLPLLPCDPIRLRQVVLNLLDNAIKHTPAATSITISLEKRGAQLLFRVKDTGQGIPKELLRRVFEPYARLDTGREHFSGLGLGLALCKTFVELHHGRIWVRSGPGSGSCFSFTIPLAAPQIIGGSK
jgi:PAS domain S-box-containing protein